MEQQISSLWLINIALQTHCLVRAKHVGILTPFTLVKEMEHSLRGEFESW